MKNFTDLGVFAKVSVLVISSLLLFCPIAGLIMSIVWLIKGKYLLSMIALFVSVSVYVTYKVIAGSGDGE